MLSLRSFSLALASLLALSSTACGGGGGTSEGGGGTTTTSTAGGGTGGSGTTSDTGGGGTTTTTEEMKLTSPEIVEGGQFPVAYTCAGKNISPQLDWTGGPTAKSYAVIFEDKSNLLIHSAIWNIPGDVMGLPTAVETAEYPANVPGAQQAKSYDNATYGYLGPCPGGALHTYEFTVHALNVATLPLVGIPSKEGVKDLVVEHTLAFATLSATSDASPP